MSKEWERVRARRPTWRKARVQERASVDNGPALLERLGNAIECKAQLVFRGNVVVRVGSLGRCCASELDRSGRVICADIEGRTFWCIVDDNSQWQLLECVLEGPGSTRPTPVECAIAQECLERLLTAASGESWREAVKALAFDDELWRCRIQISRGRSSAALDICTRAPVLTALKPLCLDEVPLSLVASLTPLRTTFGALATWKPGARMSLDATASGLRAALTVAGGPVAYGVLGSSAGRRAILLSGAAARNGGT